MAFKVRTEERTNVTRVSTLEVPQEFMDLMNAEYSVVKTDPTREIVIEGDNPKETALYVQWAKHWGLSQDEKLTVVKLATRKGDPGLVARLMVKPFDPTAAKRGRKPNAVKQGSKASK